MITVIMVLAPSLALLLSLAVLWCASAGPTRGGR